MCRDNLFYINVRINDELFKHISIIININVSLCPVSNYITISPKNSLLLDLNDENCNSSIYKINPVTFCPNSKYDSYDVIDNYLCSYLQMYKITKP